MFSEPKANQRTRMSEEELEIHWFVDYVYPGSNTCLWSILFGSAIRLVANVQLLH